MERLEKYEKEHLHFLDNFIVPFDNNAAERQMRSVKTKKKVSGQNQSIENARCYTSIQTINQTCILQGENTLDKIRDILD